AGTPLLGEPMQICTETFLRLGSFETKSEAESVLKYYKTKFFRVMVGILKTTQHSTTTFRFVPLQDFTQNSDIDWSKTISEIDQQLYKKYNLTEEEIAFIEEEVQPMD
ncbi:MAG: restriction endonuclease, partial [Bacteroides sp.]|nr:restriction endonuclease [Bacteroides sp.]